VWIFFDGQVLEDPSNEEVVDSYLGPNATRLEGREFDLVIVGASPGGLRRGMSQLRRASRGVRPHRRRASHGVWLPREILRNERAFVLTGQDLLRNQHPPPEWSLGCSRLAT
jgi:hypothetical protein